MAWICVGCSVVVCWDRRVGDEDVIDVLRYRGVEARAARAAGDYRDSFGGHFEYVGFEYVVIPGRFVWVGESFYSYKRFRGSLCFRGCGHSSSGSRSSETRSSTAFGFLFFYFRLLFE